MSKTAFLFSSLLILFSTFYGQIPLKDASNIKTILLKPNISNRYAPIIRLGESLTLSFDDINANEELYTYTIVHCDYNWKKSNINETEYINGYASYRIENFENSFNTLLAYTHYELSIPNENTKLKLSGNYIVSVFNENNELVFQRPFVVYQPKVTVGVSVHRSRDISTLDSKQSVQFIINQGNFRINNPQREIFPVVIQNNNWETAIKELKPQFYRGNQLLYKYDKETSFWGGNEFLHFDTKSIRSSTLNIATVELGRELYHTYLYTNEPRNGQPYTLAPDINGNYVIRILEGENPSLDADYSWVHFYLTMPKITSKELFVHGNFNNWQLTEENKLTYNEVENFYEGKILLKQGFYNYQYTTKDENGTIEYHDVDGSHFQTENDYTVLVYYQKFGARYTEVIGVGYGNSEKINN